MLTACAGAGSGGGQVQTSPSSGGGSANLSELNVAASAPATTLDPTMTLDESSEEIYAAIFDPLITYNARDQIMPDLATSWKIGQGGTRYTFHLARHIKFQNGQTMSSADVVASIDRAERMGQSSQELKSVVRSVRAAGPNTVVLTLKHPYSAILAVLANPLPELPIMPAKYARSTHGLNPPDLIGTGPYEIKRWISDQYTLLTKFNGYTPAEHVPATGLGGDRIAYFKNIKYTPISQPETRLAGLQRNEFQYAESLPLTSYKTVASDSNLKAERITESQNEAFFLNQRPSALMSNVFFRRAVVAALNDRAILNVVASGVKQFYAPEGSLFWPQQREWYDASAGHGIYDQANAGLAKSLLKKAHYHGQNLTILTNQTYQSDYEEAEAAASQLKAVGINATLRVLDWPGAVAALGQPKGWDMFASSGVFQADPIGWNVMIAPGGALDPGFKSSAMSRLLQQASTTLSQSTRARLYRQVQHTVWTQVPLIPIGKLDALDAISSKLQGYQPFFMPRFWNVK